MSMNEAVEQEQPLVALSTAQHRAVEIPNAPPVRLQRLDLARHIAITPDDKRYVVATFDDTHIGRGYVTAIYPQQGGYLTLYRLVVCEVVSATPEEAIERHISFVQAVQQGRLNELVRSLQE